MMSTEPPHHPSNYVMLNDNQYLVPPPQRRNLPRYHQPHPKSSSGGKCCLKCICCCYCCLFFFIILLTVVLYILYAMYKPQVPSYKVDKFAVTAFEILPDLSIQDEISVTVKANNPNGGIAFIYRKDSEVSILYKNKTLCKGEIPSFKQPEKNVSTIKVELQGKSKFGSGIQDSLMADQKAGRVPLLVAVKAPITVVLAGWPMRQVLVKLNCSLVLDSLTMGKQIKILSSKYDYDISF